jgi:hypothetical protein
MPAGTCDPASRGDAFNMQQMAVANGMVDITVRYGWDGVSVRPDCDGPLVDGTGPVGNRWALKVTNNDTVSWYVHTVGRRGQPRHLELLPGVTRTYTAAQGTAAGYASITDLESLNITTSPTG